ncbi:MAG: hypothetical protein V3T17_09845 [Pseudomonadales bacterium]
MKLLLRSLLILILVILAGCSTSETKNKPVPVQPAIPDSVLYRQGYVEGIQQVMWDLKGKMMAREQFTYEPAIVICPRVKGKVINGAYRPSRIECGVSKQGGYVEEVPINLPRLGEER